MGFSTSFFKTKPKKTEKKCAICGVALKHTDSLCLKCGKGLLETTQVNNKPKQWDASEVRKKCVLCRMSVESDTVTCPKCGKGRFESIKKKNSVQPRPKRRVSIKNTLKDKQEDVVRRTVGRNKQREDGNTSIMNGILIFTISLGIMFMFSPKFGIFGSREFPALIVIICPIGMSVGFLAFLHGLGVLIRGVPIEIGCAVFRYCPYCHHMLGAKDLPTPGCSAKCPKCSKTFARSEW